MTSSRLSSDPSARGRPSGGGAPRRAALLGCALALVLGACGGGDDDDDGGGAAGGDDLVIGEPGGRPASAVETDQLRLNARSGASRALGLNFGNLLQLDADTNGSGGDGSDSGALLTALDDGSDDFFARTLGVDDPGAVVVREGDVITIDPDDARLCADDPAESFDDDLEIFDDGDDAGSTCRQLVADFTVRLEALSEDSGVIDYLFEGESVLSIGYSPGGVGQALSLDGLQRVLERIDTLEGGEAPPATLAGTVRWDARVLDDTPGAEAGELEVSVSDTITVTDGGTSSSFSLAPSRVLLIRTDAGTGEAHLSVDWGALRLVAESAAEEGQAASLTSFDLGGLTLELDAAEGSPAISLSNLGIGDVPLNIRVDSVDSLSLALETFGISLDTESGIVTFDTAAGVDLAIDNLTGLIEERAREYTARFTAAAPAGTRLVERAEDVVEVLEGGPLSASFVASDATGSVQSEVSAGAGSCFGDPDPDDDGSQDGDSTDGNSTDGDAADDDALAGLELVVVPCP